MKKYYSANQLASILLLFLITVTTVCAQNEQSSGVSGNWQGNLSIGPTTLKIVFHFTQSADSITGTMDSPDQAVFGLPLDKVTLQGDSLTCILKKIGARFDAKINAGNKTITGVFRQGPYNLDLVLEKTEKIQSGPVRPQEPKKPYPYKEEEVSFENTKAGVTLSGTLTLPEKGEKFAAVVLVSGSGQQNRDEELLGHKPFLVLADFLTRNGFAVLRYDDRGTAKSTGNFAASTSFDFADDAAAAFHYLKTRKEINPAKIGVLGHSEGGLIAPIVANANNDLAFIIMLAGPGINGEEIIKMQSELISRAEGLPESIIKIEKRLNDRVFSILKNEKDTAKVRQEIMQVFADYTDALPDSMKDLPQTKPEFAAQQVKSMLTPWFLTFITYDPVTSLEKVRCPVLAINGSLDLQVPPKENLEAIKQALSKAGNKKAVVKELPGLNHLFQKAKTGAPSEYAKIEETIDQSALDEILLFLQKGI